MRDLFFTVSKSVRFTDEAKRLFGVNGDIFVVKTIDYRNGLPTMAHLIPRPFLKGVHIDAVDIKWLQPPTAHAKAT